MRRGNIARIHPDHFFRRRAVVRRSGVLDRIIAGLLGGKRAVYHADVHRLARKIIIVVHARRHIQAAAVIAERVRVEKAVRQPDFRGRNIILVRMHRDDRLVFFRKATLRKIYAAHFAQKKIRRTFRVIGAGNREFRFIRLETVPEFVEKFRVVHIDHQSAGCAVHRRFGGVVADFHRLIQIGIVVFSSIRVGVRAVKTVRYAAAPFVFDMHCVFARFVAAARLIFAARAKIAVRINRTVAGVAVQINRKIRGRIGRVGKADMKCFEIAFADRIGNHGKRNQRIFFRKRRYVYHLLDGERIVLRKPHV